jgi:hypothetical protein
MIGADKSLRVTVISVQKLSDLRLIRPFLRVACHHMFLLQMPQKAKS